MPVSAWYICTLADGGLTVSALPCTNRMGGVPAGKYTLHAWHERTGMIDLPVEVASRNWKKPKVPGRRKRARADRNVYYKRKKGRFRETWKSRDRR